MRKARINFNSFKIHEDIVNNLHSIQDIDDYNNYMIANIYLNKRSGIFTLNEFIEILIKKEGFSYFSLKYKQNVNKFKKELFKKFKRANFFFQHIERETFKFISYRKILNNVKSSKHENNYYYFPIISTTELKDFQLYKRTFKDLIIGTYLLTHNNYSNKQVADHFKITISRVQQATRRNEQKKIIRKIFRLAQTPCENKNDAKELRKKLWDVNICSIIKKKNKVFYICTFRTNNYDTNLPSHIGRVRKSAEVNSIQKYYSKEISGSSILFKLTNGRKLKIPLFKKEFQNLSYFNFKKNWTLNNYVQKYAVI